MRDYAATPLAQFSGVTSQVVVKIFGTISDELDRKSKEAAQLIGASEAPRMCRWSRLPERPRFVVRFKPEQWKPFGFHPVEVMEAVGPVYEATAAAQTYRGEPPHR